MIPKELPFQVDQDTLDQIILGDFMIPADHQAVYFLPGLMSNLGSPNSELRENSLDVLWIWLEKGQFDNETVVKIADQMVSNLKISLGEINTDSVFLRAFSALILGCAIEFDIELRTTKGIGLFNDDQIHTWLKTAMELLRDEKDLRGYVEAKGWAHCSAHTGDLLATFAKHQLIDRNDLQDILNTLQVRFTTPVESVFVHNEDERLAAVVLKILQRELVSEEFFKTWLEGFISNSEHMDWKSSYTHPTWNCARVNTKAFLRGIYFFLVYGYKDQPEHHNVELAEKLKPMLLNTLRQIYPTSRYADGL